MEIIMDKYFILLFICLLCLAGCASTPKFGSKAWNQCYSGGDGSSFDKPIVINYVAHNKMDIQKSCITYLSHFYGKYPGDWTMYSDVVNVRGKNYYSTMVTKDGATHQRIFDISSVPASPEYLKTLPIKQLLLAPIDGDNPVSPGFHK
jgi:hypothetical protein